MLITNAQENLFVLLISFIITVNYSLSLTVIICCSAKKEEKSNVDGFTDDPRPKLAKQKSKLETAKESSSKSRFFFIDNIDCINYYRFVIENKSAEAKSGGTKSETSKKFKKEGTKNREEPSNKEEK